jgi:hypothetical protein
MIRSRSNWATAPSTYSSGQLTVVEVSIASARDRSRTPAGPGGDYLDQVVEGAPEPVQLGDHEGIALAEVVEAVVQLRPLPKGTGGVLLEDVAAAGRVELVELGGEVLVRGGGAGVAHQVAAGGAGRSCRLPTHCVLGTRSYAASSGMPS